MRILVTGISGFIGGHLARKLVLEGHEVTGLLRDTKQLTSKRSNSNPGSVSDFEYVFADLRNFSQTLQAVKKTEPEAVFHMAAAGVTDPFLPLNSAIRSNIYGTTNLLQACFARNANETPRKVIVARTPGEKSAATIYAASKAAGWNFCKMFSKAYQWPINGAMIFQAYGPGQSVDAIVPSAFRAALKQEDFLMTSGQQKKDWIHIDDVISGLVEVLFADLPAGNTVELGTGQAVSTGEVVDQIFRLVKSSGRPLLGTLQDRPGEDAVQVAAANKTEKTVGWRARITLSEGLTDFRDELLKDPDLPTR